MIWQIAYYVEWNLIQIVHNINICSNVIDYLCKLFMCICVITGTHKHGNVVKCSVALCLLYDLDLTIHAIGNSNNYYPQIYKCVSMPICKFNNFFKYFYVFMSALISAQKKRGREGTMH